MNFDITSMLNNESMKFKNYETRLVFYKDIIKNPYNVYPINEIQDLVDSMQSHGLLDPLMIAEMEDDSFLLISGERRLTAIIKLNEETDTKMEYITCQVIPKGTFPQEILDLLVHEMNLSSRSFHKLEKDAKLAIVDSYVTAITNARKVDKTIKGRTRDIVSEKLGISERTLQDLITEGKGGKKKTEKEPKPKKEPTYYDLAKKFQAAANSVQDMLDEYDIEMDDNQEKVITLLCETARRLKING